MSKAIPKSTQDQLGLFLSKWRNRVVAKEITPPVLDIACGLNILAKKFEGGLGIDIQDHGDADLVVDSFSKLPYESSTFETITIVASLNYFDEPEKVLGECARLLTPTGRLVITLLNPAIGKYWHKIREPWAKYPGYSQKRLEALAQPVSLHIIKRKFFMLGCNNLYVLSKTKGEV